MRPSSHPLSKRAATTLVVAFALVSGALAYFTTTGSGSAAGSVTTLSAPATPAASASGTTATITWNASTIGGTVAASSYTVERYNSSGTDLGAASCSPVASSSGSPDAFGSFTCADSPTGGTYKYKITAKYHSSWTATTGFTSTVTVQSSTSTSASGPATDSTNTAIATTSISSTLSGAGSGATGTITFKIFGPQASAPSTCTSGGTTVGTATVSGNATYNPSAGYTPTSAGTYWWYASYGGDSGNTASASTCGSGMSSTVVTNASGVTASAPASGNAGSAIAASAIGSTLSGATSGATGTITFTVFGPQTTAPSTCTSGGTTVGTSSVSGNGTYHPSAGYTPATVGTYWWYASYGGDSNNAASSSTCGSGMASTVVGTANSGLTASGPSTGTTSTLIASSSISSTLSGATSGATGTITYKVFGPQSTAPTTCTSGGTTVGTATVSGNGTYNPSAGFTPSTAGSYWWYASYGGDSNNAASTSTCGSGMASTSVTNFTITTAAGPTTDAAGTAIATTSISSTLSGATSGATGTITYKVFGPQTTAPTTCTSGGTTVGTATVSGNNTYHPSAGYTPSTAGTYWWYASYNGDSNNAAATSTCGSAMAATVVYSISSVATGSGSSTSAVTSSFTVQANTPYVLLISRSSASGDSVSSFSSSSLSPALTTASFTQVASQNYGSTNWQWAYYFVSSGSASGTGTITVNFAQSGNAYLDLVALGGASTSVPVVMGNVGKATGSGTSATANLPSAPASVDAGLVMVGAPGDLSPSAPTASPSMTNMVYSHQPSLSQATFYAVPDNQNETLTLGSSATWGTIALEISAPLGQNGNTTTTTASGPSTGNAGTAISAGSISSTLSGATSGATGTITYTVFGPQSTAPTTCTSGGTTVGTASVSGNGTYNPSAGFTPSATGTYWWYASYSGDLSSNKSSASTCGSGMSSTVVGSATPTLTVSGPGADTASTAISASSISSTMSGAVSGATGTITYKVFGPQATHPSTCASGGTTVGTATVSGNNTYHPSAGYTPSTAGTYWWYVSYNGDSSDAASNSTCGAGMSATYVYSVTSVASNTATSGSSVATSSVTLASSTTYLLLVSADASSGNGISSISSSGLSPALNTASFTSITSQTYNSGAGYEWAYWITTSGSASGSGTISVNFNNAISGPGSEAVVDLVQLGGTSTTAPIVTSNEANATGSSTSATSQLPNTPSSSDLGLVFLSGKNDLGPSAPTASPAMTNAYFTSNYAGVYDVAPATTSSYSFPISGPGGGPWGTIGLELSAPLGFNGNTTTTTASAPSTGNVGTAISASSISSTLSGATSGATGTITYTVFGPQSTAPTTCTSGGTTVGTASVSGNGTYNPSAGFTPSATGTYWWSASYSGDLSSNQSSASTCGSGMISTVVSTSSTAITASGPGSAMSGTAIAASSISSTLSGGVNTPSGTITYKVFGPQATAPSTCTSGGTTVGTATVSGNATYHPSAGFTPSSAGTYWWYASYGGDSNNAASNSGCGSGMSPTYVYSMTSVANVTSVAATSATTSSFTVQPNTTYLLFAFRKSSSGDSVTSISSSGLSPALSTASFTSIASQLENGSDNMWAYWITTSGSASGSGTITVNFSASAATVLDLVALGGNNTTNPVVTGNVGVQNGAKATTVTANLPSAPSSGDAGVVFLASSKSLGSPAPAATPSMTNLFLDSSADVGIYGAAPANQNETFSSVTVLWGSIALEIAHP